MLIFRHQRRVYLWFDCCLAPSTEICLELMVIRELPNISNTKGRASREWSWQHQHVSLTEFLGMWILGPHPRPTELETLKAGPSNQGFNNPSWWFSYMLKFESQWLGCGSNCKPRSLYGSANVFLGTWDFVKRLKNEMSYFDPNPKKANVSIS